MNRHGDARRNWAFIGSAGLGLPEEQRDPNSNDEKKGGDQQELENAGFPTTRDTSYDRTRPESEADQQNQPGQDSHRAKFTISFSDHVVQTSLVVGTMKLAPCQTFCEVHPSEAFSGACGRNHL